MNPRFSPLRPPRTARIALVFAWFVVTGSVLAQDAATPAPSVVSGVTVTGRVVDMKTGAGIGGAVVRLDGVDLSALTSKTGYFAIASVPADAYTFSVYYRREWYPYVRDAAVARSAKNNFEIELPCVDHGADERITVTATRTPLTLRSTPEALTVLTSEDLQAYPATDLADILRGVPGLNLYEAGGSPADSSVNVRGFTGGGENDYLLVLVDGVRINDFNNGRVDWREIPLQEIERVEILRGPVSALYGDSAVGGVVKIFTRRTEGPALGASATLGNHGETGLGVQFGNPAGHVNLRGSVQYGQGNGWRDNSAWEDLQARLRLGREQTHRAWNLQVWLRSDDHENPGAIPSSLADSSPTESITPFDRAQRERVSVTWQDRRPAGRWNVESQLSVRSQDDELVETIFQSTTQRNFSGTLFWGETQGRKTFGQDNQFTWTMGLEANGGTYDSDYFDLDLNGNLGAQTAQGTGDRIGAGLYGQFEWQLFYDIRLTSGFRYDRVEDSFKDALTGTGSIDTSNDALSPRLGAVWNPSDNVTLWANAGRNFKAPTPFQLYDQRQFFGSAITNPNLEPQRGESFSVGYRHDFDDRYSVDASYYHLNLENEIGFDFANFRTDNIERSRHRGIEIAAHGRYGENWRGEFSWSLNDAQVRQGVDTGNQIKEIPRYTASAGVSWKQGLWSASGFLRDVRGSFVDGANRLPLDRYMTVDASVTRDFGFGLEARIEAFNLLDEQYATWGFASPIDGSPQVYPGQEPAVRVMVRYHPNWVH